ncbi:hypothetical protein [Methylohalobius crimeensis]|uniref:hypothetical protein n=1 Tax=Methylohalobius crimeensis TaxID=244365 RepID=UPI0004034F46|nr:hypothetical protein [Methylohalobius crimeensis]
MDVAFESRFAKDLKHIQDASLRRRVKQLINETQNASSKHEIPNLTKLKGFPATIESESATIG